MQQDKFLDVIKAAIAQGNTPEAVQFLKKHLRTSPNDAAAWHWLGVAYFRGSDFRASLHSFGRAHRLQPGVPVSVYYLGLCHERLGNKSGAREFYRKTLSINPSFQLARQKLGIAPSDEAQYTNNLKTPLSTDTRQEWAKAQAQYDIAQEAAAVEQNFDLMGLPKVDGKRVLRWRNYAVLALFIAFLAGFVFTVSRGIGISRDVDRLFNRFVGTEVRTLPAGQGRGTSIKDLQKELTDLRRR